MQELLGDNAYVAGVQMSTDKTLLSDKGVHAHPIRITLLNIHTCKRIKTMKCAGGCMHTWVPCMHSHCVTLPHTAHTASHCSVLQGRWLLPKLHQAAAPTAALQGEQTAREAHCAEQVLAGVFDALSVCCLVALCARVPHLTAPLIALDASFAACSCWQIRSRPSATAKTAW